MTGRIKMAATLAVVVTTAAVNGGCRSPSTEYVETSRGNMLRDLEVLAGDELEGRGLGQLGLERALDYAASELERAGTEPGYTPARGPESFLHPVPIVQYTYGQGISARIRTSNGERLLRHGEDMVLLAPGNALEPVPMHTPVFVGYGISEPERGWDDYAGLDVAGRMVVMLEGQYPGLPDDLQAEYSDPARGGLRRAQAAEEHGVTGIIVIPPAAFFAQWSVLVSMRGRGTAVAARKYSLQAPEEAPFPVIALSRDVIETLFAGTGFDPLATDVEYRVFPLASVELSLTKDGVRRTSLATHNAVGLVPGADPEFADEVVVASAHIDHLGQVDGEIFNGANDDASGSVMVLELARRLARHPAPRSVLCVLFTAEESDHLGSIHFLEKPPLPGFDIVASVNLEHMGRSGDGTLLATATPGLLEVTRAVVRGRGRGRLRVQPLESPQIIGGSDSFSFLLHGIPLVIIGGGAFPEYHTPADDIDLIDLELLADGLLAIEDLVRRIAAEPGPGMRGPREQSSSE